MLIKSLSEKSGLPAKTIRYYESVGLIMPLRQANNYRTYTEDDVERLQFIGMARQLGFSIGEIRRLLGGDASDGAVCGDVIHSLKAQLDLIDQKIRELERLRSRLSLICEQANGVPEDQLCGAGCLAWVLE